MTETLIQEQPKVFETGCCPRFDSSKWQEQEITWNNKLFVRDHVLSIWHMPINYGSVMTHMQKKIQESGGTIVDNLWLNDEKSSWGSDLYIAVDKEIPDMENVRLSGKFLTKAFKGEYREIPQWMQEMQHFIASKGKTATKWFFYYAYCPKCAKEYGENPVVILAQVLE